MHKLKQQNMSPASFFLFCLLSQLPLLTSTAAEENSTCPPFDCGKLSKIRFPFTKTANPECGLCLVDGCDKKNQRIKFRNEEKEPWYEVTSISQANNIVIIDEEFKKLLHSGDCEIFKNLTLLHSPFISLQITHNQTFFKCNSSSPDTTPPEYFKYTGCENTTIYFSQTNDTSPKKVLPQCSIIQLPAGKDRNPHDPFALLTHEISLDLQVSHDCRQCFHKRGQCEIGRKGEFHCANAKKGNDRLRLKLALGLGIGCPAILLICLLFYFRCGYKQIYAASNLLSRNISSHPSSKSDLEGSVYFGVPIFSYSELEEATNHFDQAKELGDGGFGAVYHGKLQDGREVAVKRLYEHNYRRVEQFMNEVQILTRLRHKNLVTLYGCTSSRSRELLLVYEFIPNGTVADHLHSDGAKSGSLTWPIRMSIAIETATALAYLHASEIIHRDVKTTNILLDSNFCVKVADFGLSRLFPTDVTHVSTAPQGTPGYVDPEYHQCYQLTSKSDVYSFGVVLIELISSMPAVDISRHRYEINLANLAINKIHKRAFDELVDPRLGFESDLAIKRMVMLVAELAYQCLQQDKELRPSMDEVLETLKNIEMGNYEWENSSEEDDETGELKCVQPPPSTDCDEVGLLKNRAAPPSPDSVTGKWLSVSTTPNASG